MTIPIEEGPCVWCGRPGETRPFTAVASAREHEPEGHVYVVENVIMCDVCSCLADLHCCSDDGDHDYEMTMIGRTILVQEIGVLVDEEGLRAVEERHSVAHAHARPDPSLN